MVDGCEHTGVLLQRRKHTDDMMRYPVVATIAKFSRAIGITVKSLISA